MNDPISALFARNGTCAFANSAMPDAPVLPVTRERRLRTLGRRALFARRTRRLG